MTILDKGDLAHCAFTFATSAGAATDPTVVKFSYRKPGGTSTTTLTYGVEVALVRSAVGSYYVDLDMDTVGLWHVRAYATGTGQSAVTDTIFVKDSEAD